MAHTHGNKATTCPNCGTQLQQDQAFCPHCGQENHDLRMPFRHFAYEFLESVTHFDTKLWSTLKMIFTRPGQLTKDFVEGKRARYVKPAQFYVFVSVIFFALLTLKVDRVTERATTEDADDRRLASLYKAVPRSAWDSIRWNAPAGETTNGPYDHLVIPIDRPYYRQVSDRLRHPSEAVLDSLAARADDAYDTLPGAREALRHALAMLPEADSLNVCYARNTNGLAMSFCDRKEEAIFQKGHLTNADVDTLLGAERDSVGWFEKRMIRSLGRLNLNTQEGKERIAHMTVKALSVIMFILMPFTAVLLLWIFFPRRYYWEHLIFSVHQHTIYFLFSAIALVLQLLLPDPLPRWISFVLMAVCTIYLLLALRRVYGKSWPATVLRTLLMGIPYFIATTVLLLAGMLWGLISL